MAAKVERWFWLFMAVVDAFILVACGIDWLHGGEVSGRSVAGIFLGFCFACSQLEISYLKEELKQCKQKP